MAIACGAISTCMGQVGEGYGGLCWNPTPWRNQYAFGGFGFFLGAGIALLGAVILVGPSVAGSLGKLRGAGSDTER